MKFRKKISAILALSVLMSVFAFSVGSSAKESGKGFLGTTTKSYTMILGETASIKFVVYGSGSAKNTVSKSSNKNVVAIVGKSKGSSVKFKAKKVGSATLTSKNGRNTIKYKINVVKKDLWKSTKVSLGKGLYVENAKISLYRSYGNIAYRVTGVLYNSNAYALTRVELGASAKKGNVKLTNLYSNYIYDIPAYGRQALKFEQSLYLSVVAGSKLATSAGFEVKGISVKSGVAVTPETMIGPALNTVFDGYNSKFESISVSKLTEYTYGSYTYKFSGVWNKSANKSLELSFKLYDQAGNLLGVTNKQYAGSYTTGSVNYNVTIYNIATKVYRVEAVVEEY